MANAAPMWTVDMVNALPDDGQRREVIDGELFVTPAPSLRHQRAVLRLAVRLMEYSERARLGVTLIAPLDITFSPSTNVQPDVLVVPLVANRAPRSWAEAGRLLLAAEVRSPSTARLDRAIKRRLYQREGVPEYWIVDTDSRTVERWRPEDVRPEVLSERMEWMPEGATKPLVIDLEEFFGALLEE